MFPGDPEFTLENYWMLPYPYVIIAVFRASELRRKELNENERPVALLTSLTANINRDSKQRRQPYELSEFCIYGEAVDDKLPHPRNGAAAMKLIDMDMFPSWALFAYADLKKSSEKGIAPEFLGLIGEDAVLLAPYQDDGGFVGMLIALESASDSFRIMESPNGNKYEVMIPKLNAKATALEDVFLKVYQEFT